MQQEIRYPVGIQTFSEVIEGGYVYVDKTAYIHRMTHLKKYVFLSRPRRFGKSLLTSTLMSYFEGRKELFKGLAIEKLEKDWVKYPVIRIDLSGGKHLGKDALLQYLAYELDGNARRLGIEAKTEAVNLYFMNLIIKAHEKYQLPVVLLIDEYDAPLLDVVHEKENLQELRQVMQNFYSPIKKCDAYLKFGFLTGITKFSQLSIFSELNNLANVSMLKDYAAVCGITEQELLGQMDKGIEVLAEENGMTKEQAFKALKANYDGYHFAWPSEDVYNPFSLLNALANRNLDAYWFGSGTPTFLIKMMQKFRVSPSQLGSPLRAKVSSFDTQIENASTLTPLLYQSGYITIKDCSPLGLYTLDIPNKEIRIGLMESLVPGYLGAQTDSCGEVTILMQEALLNDDIEEALKLLKTFLGTVPQTNNTNYEGHWQQIMFVIFSLLGIHVDVEVRTSDGRVDMVARTASKLYLFELKLNQSAEAAMNQINLKNYSARFALCGLPVVKVAINFDAEAHNITDWKITPQ